MTRPKPNPTSPNPAFSLGLYVLLALVAFFPCLFRGQAYFDNDLLAQFGPWRAFLRDQLSQGRFPLWNPYLLGGQPFFADLQNMMLYPLNYLTLPFSVPYGLSVFFFIHMVWAALGMHLWLRSLGLSATACRVGALLFAFSGFFWLELIHPPVLAAFSWLPWLFFFLREWIRNLQPKAAFGAGLAFALLFLCGSLQVSVGAFYGGAAYFFFQWLTRTHRKSSGKKMPDQKAPFLCALLFLWGALPLFAQFIPTAEFARLSDRGSSPKNYDDFNARTALEPSSLYQFLFPRMLLPRGESLDHAVQEISKDGEMPWAGNWGYLGVWVPLLFIGALKPRKEKTPVFLAVFLLTWLVIALGPATPFHRMFCFLFPGFSLLKVPYRFLFLYVLAACALAAFGLEQWLSGIKASRQSAFPALLAGLLLIPSLAGGFQTWRESLALFLGLASLGLVFLKPAWKKAGNLCFQVSLVLPLLLNGWADFTPGPASNFDFVKNSKSIPRIAEKVRPYRVIFGNNMLYPIQVGEKKYVVNYPQDASTVFPMKNFGGYNPLALQAKKDIARISLPAAVQLGALEGLLSMDGGLKIPGFEKEAFPPFYLYHWKKPLSYAFAPGHIEVVPDKTQRLERLGNPAFDASRTALLSSPLPEYLPTSIHNEPAHLRCRLDMENPDIQSFTVELNRDNLMVFADVVYPGWKAFVDGNPTPLFTADHFLRAVFVRAGRHQVEFKFEPTWWLPIRIGLALWLGLTLLGFLLPRFLSRRPSRA